VKRLSAVALIACIAMAGCAEDAAPADDGAAAQTVATPESVPAEPGDTVGAAQDFGSRYVGSPVAFWFWAPY